MKTFIFEKYKVNICHDILEWGELFYGMPKNAILENREKLESECMGFCHPDDNEIYIFVPPNFKIEDFEATVAHEIGHLFYFEPLVDSFFTEELKAENYEKFYILVRGIIKESEKFLKNIETENKNNRI
jgi:hypothetical protein